MLSCNLKLWYGQESDKIQTAAEATSKVKVTTTCMLVDKSTAKEPDMEAHRHTDGQKDG